MPKRIPVQGVIVQRDGKSIMPPLNKPFEFTDAEIAEIGDINPKAIKRVEVAADDTDYVAVKDKTPPQPASVAGEQNGELTDEQKRAAAIAAAKEKANGGNGGEQTGDSDL